MNHYIHFRKSIDWSLINESNFLEQDFPYNSVKWEQMIKNMFPFIKLWNQYLGVNYFEYRNQLKNISQYNFSKINSHKIINNVDELEGEYILLSTDDDDFFDHNIYEEINQSLEGRDDIDIIIWKHTMILSHGFVCYSNKNNHMATNNYALTHNALKKIKDPFVPHYVLNDELHKHAKCDSLCNSLSGENFFGNFKVLNLIKRLNTTHKTLASASHLSRINKTKFLNQLFGLQKRKISGLWLKEEESKLNDLHKNIKLNIKI